MKKSLLYYCLFLLALVFTACGTDEETVDPVPTITIPNTAPTTAQVGTTISFNVAVVADSKIKSIVVRKDNIDIVTKTTGFTNATSDTYPFSYTVAAADAGKTLSFAFVVTDNKGKTANASYSVAVGTPATLTTYTNVTLYSNLASTVPTGMGSFYSSTSNAATNSGTAVAANVDITYGIVSNLPYLVSPDARTANNLSNGTPALSGLTKTTFALAPSTFSFDNATAAQVAALPDPTLDKIPLSAGQTYVFKNAAGKKGVIMVRSLPSVTAAGGTTQNLVMDVKVLK